MTTNLEDMIQQRRERAQHLREQGIDVYPAHYHRSHTIEEVLRLFTQMGESGTEDNLLHLAGRIVASRHMGKAVFIDLRDGSGKIQVYFRSDEVGGDNYKSLLQDYDLGDFIGVSGYLFRTHRGEISLRVSDFMMLAKALQPLPEKWHGLVDVEKRYRQRYLDLISTQGVRETFQMRSRIITTIRHFLDERGFLEVETPILHSSAGGAMARPFVTHHNALNQDLYLRIATELHLKRLIVGNFDKVYEIGRIFRNEGISTKHNPEFTTLESYEAYADYYDVMKMVEEMVSCVAQEVLGTTQVKFGEDTIELSPPWQRISLRQAIKERCGIDFEDYPDTISLRTKMQELGVEVGSHALLQGRGKPFSTSGSRSGVSLGRGKLIDELISTFVEPTLVQPTFLVDYPVELSPLAKRKIDNPQLVERFEAFAGGMEIANAFTELNDPVEQRERLHQQQEERLAGDEEAELPDEDFLQALEHGMPPTAGLGIGIDRLVMLLTNHQSIREVILFPLLRSKIA